MRTTKLSVYSFEYFSSKGLLKNSQLSQMIGSRLFFTSRKHHCSVKIFCTEHLLEYLLKLHHWVEISVILHWDAIFFFYFTKQLNFLELLGFKMCLDVLKMSSLEILKEILSGVLKWLMSRIIDNFLSFVSFLL